jgi:hypothetical protein
MNDANVEAGATSRIVQGSTIVRINWTICSWRRSRSACMLASTEVSSKCMARQDSKSEFARQELCAASAALLTFCST